MTSYLRVATLVVAGGNCALAAGQCIDENSRIDSAPDQGAEVNICPCFGPDEVAMTILDVPAGGVATLAEIHIFWASFFGGQLDSLESAVIVYDMNQGGPADPGSFTPLCTEQEGCILLGPVLQDGGLNVFDVRAFGIELPESRFGLGLEFLTDQSQGNPFFVPSVASDNDGHNNAGGIVRNWVLADGVTWQTSLSLGVSGDWIIRAVIEVCAAACPWDLIGDDGIVGIQELFNLFCFWGTDPGGPPDFDNDGIVGITDLFELFAHWGLCP